MRHPRAWALRNAPNTLSEISDGRYVGATITVSTLASASNPWGTRI